MKARSIVLAAWAPAHARVSIPDRSGEQIVAGSVDGLRVRVGRVEATAGGPTPRTAWLDHENALPRQAKNAPRSALAAGLKCSREYENVRPSLESGYPRGKLCARFRVVGARACGPNPTVGDGMHTGMVKTKSLRTTGSVNA